MNKIRYFKYDKVTEMIISRLECLEHRYDSLQNLDGIYPHFNKCQHFCLVFLMERQYIMLSYKRNSTILLEYSTIDVQVVIISRWNVTIVIISDGQVHDVQNHDINTIIYFRSI